MKALLFDRAGDPQAVLRFGDAPLPAVLQNYALVRVSARPIHPADLSFVRGTYRIKPVFPQVGGLEGAGTIVESGPGVALSPGTRVAFRWPGSWSEYTLVPRERLIAVPDDIGDDIAAQISLNPVTAWALLEQADARSGDVIVVTAATSTVALLVRTLASARGITTIGIVRGSAQRCAEHYPDGAFSDNEPNLADAIRATLGGRRLQALIDSVGGPIVTALVPALSAGARAIAYGVFDARPATMTNAALIYANLTWTGFGIDRWLEGQSQEASAAMFAALLSLAVKNALPLPVAARFPLDAFAAAIDAAQQPNERGKSMLL